MKTLRKAGLTDLQARVYLGVLSLGKANLFKISQHTNIDKSNVSKALKNLLTFELIERYIGKSTVFKPVPLQVAILILTQRKKHEYLETIEGLEHLAKEVEIAENVEIVQEEDYFKILPSGTESFSRNWEQALKKIKHSVDLILTEKREIKDEPIWEIYDTLLQKGVKVRWLFDRSTKDDQEFNMRIRQFENLLKYPNLEMRICFNCLKPYGVMCDKDFVIIFLDEGTPLKCIRSFWTNNSQMVLNFKNHFEGLWEKAILFSDKNKG